MDDRDSVDSIPVFHEAMKLARDDLRRRVAERRRRPRAHKTYLAIARERLVDTKE